MKIVRSPNAYPKLIGYDILPLCLCGETVKPIDTPQQLEWDPSISCWVRLCHKCLGKPKHEAVPLTPVDAALGGWPIV